MLFYPSLNQSIAQLFIILRVAKGRSVTHEWSTRAAAAPTTVEFSRSVTDGTEESKDEQITGTEHDSAQMHSVSEKTVDRDVCMQV